MQHQFIKSTRQLVWLLCFLLCNCPTPIITTQEKETPSEKTPQESIQQTEEKITSAGKSLYSALKNNKTENIGSILEGLNKTKVVGYALYLAAKDKQLEPTLIKLYDNEKIRNKSHTNDQQIDCNLCLTNDQQIDCNLCLGYGLIYAIEKTERNGQINKTLCDWRKALNSLYESAHPIIKKYNFNNILEVLVKDCIQTKQNYKYLGQIFDNKKFNFPSALVVSLHEELEKQRPSHESEKIEYFDCLFKIIETLIKQIEQLKERLASPVPLNKSTLKDEDEITFGWTIPSTRDQGYYSDSEEETAPHFNGVYNLTKYGFNRVSNSEEEEIEYKAQKDPVTGKKLINNYVTSYEELFPQVSKVDF